MQEISVALIGRENLFSFFSSLLNEHYSFINMHKTLQEIEQTLQKKRPDFILMQIHADIDAKDIRDAKQIMLDLRIPVLFLQVTFNGEDVDYITLSYPDVTIIKPVTPENLKKSIDLSLANFNKLIETTNESERLKHLQTHLKNELKKHTNTYRKIIEINHHCIYNTQEMTLYCNERKITFSKKENLLLELLIRQLDHPVTYEMIDTIVWEGQGVLNSTIRSLIRRIRDKTYNGFILNIPGVGYKIESRQ